ncbi:MAG: hypothetical protein AAGL49_05580 [Pseudomonadota bacterium]
MVKRVQDEAPPRTAEAQSWVDENVAEQKVRYTSIAKEMDDLAPKRAGWYEEFLTIMETKGFNFNGDQRRVIAKEDIPTKPDRPDKVVY